MHLRLWNLIFANSAETIFFFFLHMFAQGSAIHFMSHFFTDMRNRDSNKNAHLALDGKQIKGTKKRKRKLLETNTKCNGVNNAKTRHPYNINKWKKKMEWKKGKNEKSVHIVCRMWIFFSYIFCFLVEVLATFV